MKDIVLQAQRRTKDENAKSLREMKMIPCEVYGNNKENISVKIDASHLLKVYRNAGESHIIVLDVEGEKVQVLVHDYQKHPVTGEFIHMDFYAVTKGQKVSTAIKLDFVGQSPAAKNGAIIEEYIKELEVNVLPQNLVDSFEVDLSVLKAVWDAIRIADLKIDTTKFEYDYNDEDIIAIASEMQEEIIEDEAPEFEEAEVVGGDDKNADEDKN